MNFIIQVSTIEYNFILIFLTYPKRSGLTGGFWASSKKYIATRLTNVTILITLRLIYHTQDTTRLRQPPCNIAM